MPSLCSVSRGRDARPPALDDERRDPLVLRGRVGLREHELRGRRRSRTRSSSSGRSGRTRRPRAARSSASQRRPSRRPARSARSTRASRRAPEGRGSAASAPRTRTGAARASSARRAPRSACGRRPRRARSPRTRAPRQTKSRPAPPYSSGMTIPRRPSSAMPSIASQVEVVVDVVLDRVREDALVDERADGVLEQPLLVGELEVHARPSVRTALRRRRARLACSRCPRWRLTPASSPREGGAGRRLRPAGAGGRRRRDRPALGSAPPRPRGRARLRRPGRRRACEAFPGCRRAALPRAIRSEAEAFAAGRATGRPARRAECDVDLAPVLDLPDGPLGSRQFRSSALRRRLRARARGGRAPARASSTFPASARRAVSTDERPYVVAVVRDAELAAVPRGDRARACRA